MNKKNERLYNTIAVSFTILVYCIIGMMGRYDFNIGSDLKFLPALNAIINTIAAISLIIAYRYIKAGNRDKHRKFIYVALICTGIFFMSYTLFHYTQPQSFFGGEGAIKIIYYIILISHIVMAAITLPFILFTFIRAQIGDYERHKKMARWVFPMWLYVAITGPLVYLFMYSYY